MPRVHMLSFSAIGTPASGPGSSPRATAASTASAARSEEHTSELQSLRHLVCRLLLEKKKTIRKDCVKLKRILDGHGHRGDYRLCLMCERRCNRSCSDTFIVTQHK